MPRSAITSRTPGWTASAGSLPAERMRRRPAAWRSRSAAAIWLRPAFPTQTKRTVGTSLTSQVARRRTWIVRGVGELAELPAHQVGGLLADVHGVVADPLEAAGNDDHAQAPLADVGVGSEGEDVLHDAAVGAVDELVEVDERFGATGVSVAERVERDADHLFGPSAHLLEALDERRVVRDVTDELRELRDRHAVVRHPLEVEVVVQHRQDEAEVDRDRGLAREERLDAFLDAEVGSVDLVVEGDDLVGQLDIGLRERVQAAAERAKDERALLLQRRLELVEVLLERDPHPKRPVT